METKPSQEWTQAEIQRDVILAYLGREAVDWAEHKRVDERAHHHDPDALRERRLSMDRIDNMLDELLDGGYGR